MSKMTVVATGDSIAGRRVVDYRDAPYRALAHIIQNADIAFTNLEIVLSDGAGVASDFYNLSTEPGVAQDLRTMGFDLVSFANNHTLNYGEPGVLLTLDALRVAGLPVAGAGRNLHEARRPAYADVAAGRAALVAGSSTFVPGQQATHQERDHLGRAGLSPLRYNETRVVDERAVAELRRIAQLVPLGHSGPKLRTRNVAAASNEVDFLGHRFAVGPQIGVRSTPDEGDMEEILRWVRDARLYADVVLVSMHCHEHGGTPDVPPEFLMTFARACIDAGADAFIGHGPHRLRGLEIFQGKPIFYSLANFIFQPEYIQALPGEAFVRPDMRDWTPGQWHSDFYHESAMRHAPGTWETIVPVLEFEDHRLLAITVHPVTLGGGRPWPERGTPRLAAGEDAASILAGFASLSAALGTTLEVTGDVGRVRT